jgi:hypothetical protein
MLFIELHDDETGRPLLINLNNIWEIYPHSEAGTIIGSVDANNFQHVSETYDDVFQMLARSGVDKISRLGNPKNDR